jgi:hypothetical protein
MDDELNDKGNSCLYFSFYGSKQSNPFLFDVQLK